MALQRLLGIDSTCDDFFDGIWEQSPKLYRKQVDNDSAKDVRHSELLPLREVISLLRRAHSGSRTTGHEPAEVLITKDECPTTDYPSCHAALLDGCSLIVNHADRLSPSIHNLCVKLRAIFPHVFANIYITPPRSQNSKG